MQANHGSTWIKLRRNANLRPNSSTKEDQPALTKPPLSTTVGSVTVTIGGKAAQVTFSGLTPRYAGLYQISAVVPGGITTGGAVPVMLSVAGQTSPVVTMAIR